MFDGADAVENSESSEYINIKHFIQNAVSLHVIATSRSSKVRDMSRLDGARVGEIEETQASELFYSYSQLPRDDPGIGDEIKATVKELWHFALAVTPAATYVGTILRLQPNIKTYLPEYMRRRYDLLSQKPESLVHQYSESVLTTCQTSYLLFPLQTPSVRSQFGDI